MEHTSRGRKFSRTRKTSTLIHSINALPLRCHSAATPPLLRTENAMKTNTFWDVLRRYPTATPPRLRRYSAATPPLLRHWPCRKLYENNVCLQSHHHALNKCSATPLLLRRYSATTPHALLGRSASYSAATPPLLRCYSAATPPKKHMKTHTFRTATPPLLRRTAESQSQILCALLGRIAPHPVLKKETYFNSGDTWSPQLRGSPPGHLTSSSSRFSGG